MNAAHTTILLADDDQNDIFLMQRAFKKVALSNTLQVVRNGDEVVAYLSGEGEYQDRTRFPFPALVILDLKMPRKSGLEVLAWIRAQNTPVRRVPVVVLTSSKQPCDVNTAYDLGVNSYMVKPVTFEHLTELVRSMGHFWLSLSQRPEYRAR
ncbi:MAG: response regulator [Limisphaerales bacterium]